MQTFYLHCQCVDNIGVYSNADATYIYSFVLADAIIFKSLPTLPDICCSSIYSIR